MKFSEQLVTLREKRGLLQKEIAKEIKISVHAYQRFEYGEQEPRMSALIALADFYNLSLDELVGRERERMETRKRLRLPDYDYSQTGAYFVTVCTQAHKCILGTVGAGVLTGPHTDLSEWGAVVDECIRRMPTVEHYVVMPNHIHLLIRLANGPVRTPAPTQTHSGGDLPSVIHWLKRETSRRCGVSLWQRSYYDHVIRSEADYLTKWNYIQTNPARWAEDDDYK